MFLREDENRANTREKTLETAQRVRGAATNEAHLECIPEIDGVFECAGGTPTSVGV